MWCSPTFYMSGYDVVLGTLPLTEGVDFIQKPFSVRDLERVLGARVARTS
jgi:FixJ family two-component response regulator